MSSERDTHFQGFAQASTHEVEALMRTYGRVPIAEMVDYPAFFNALQLLLARRGYDLACHTLYETSYGLGKFNIREQINETVPDLTDLPKER